MCGELGSESVNTLDKGSDSERLPASANLVLSGRNEVCDVRVREPHLLRCMHELFVNIFQGTGSLEGHSGLHDVVDLVQEPLELRLSQTLGEVETGRTDLIDFCQLVYFINRVVLVVHRVGDDEQAHISRP